MIQQYPFTIPKKIKNTANICYLYPKHNDYTFSHHTHSHSSPHYHQINLRTTYYGKLKLFHISRGNISMAISMEAL